MHYTHHKNVLDKRVPATIFHVRVLSLNYSHIIVILLHYFVNSFKLTNYCDSLLLLLLLLTLYNQ